MNKTYIFTNTKKTITPSNTTITTSGWTKIIDDLILANVKKCNPWLNYTKSSDAADIFSASINKKKNNSDFFAKAAKYLSTNSPKNSKKFIIGKTYYFGNTPIIFYDDEIQIDCETFSYDSFDDFDFLNSLTEKNKKTIIDIYIKDNADVTINI